MPLGQVEKTFVVIFALVSSLLTVIAYLAPEFYNRNNISLLMVLPSSTPGTAAAPAVDGATVILGIFGSCERPNNATTYKCESLANQTIYNISMIPLPTELQNILLPPHYFAILFWIAFGLWVLGTVGILISSVYVVEKHNTKVRASVMAHLALPLGLGIWLVVWTYFTKCAKDFNSFLKLETSPPQQFAQIGNTFVLIGLAYGCVFGILFYIRMQEKSK